MGYIDGSSACPPQYSLDDSGKHSITVNPLYKEWIIKDQDLLTWLNSMLSENVLPYVVVLHTSKAVWDALEQRYASLSRSHIIQLKKQLQTAKKGTSSMQDYQQQIKHLADKLAACAAPVSEDDLILHILDGLPSEYHPFQTSIRTRSGSDPVSRRVACSSYM